VLGAENALHPHASVGPGLVNPVSEQSLIDPSKKQNFAPCNAMAFTHVKRRRGAERAANAAAAAAAAAAPEAAAAQGADPDGDQSMDQAAAAPESDSDDDLEQRARLRLHASQTQAQRARRKAQSLQQSGDDQREQLREARRRIAQAERDAVAVAAAHAAALAAAADRISILETALRRHERRLVAEPTAAAAAAAPLRPAENAAYTDAARLCMIKMHEKGVSSSSMVTAFQAFGEMLGLPPEQMPSQTTIRRVLQEAGVLSLLQASAAMQGSSSNSLGHDGATKRTQQLEALTCTVPKPDGSPGLQTFGLGLSGMPGATAVDTSDRIVAMAADVDTVAQAMAAMIGEPAPVSQDNA
jgi:hypothetical protein